MLPAVSTETSSLASRMSFMTSVRPSRSKSDTATAAPIERADARTLRYEDSEHVGFAPARLQSTSRAAPAEAACEALVLARAPRHDGFMLCKQALASLPRAYRLALSLRSLGADDQLIADCLEIEVIAVKADRFAEAEHVLPFV